MGLVSTGLVLTGDMGEITVRVGGGEGGEGRGGFSDSYAPNY